MERVNYLKEREATVRKNPEWNKLKSLSAKQRQLDQISEEIKRTLGETSGSISPLDR